MSLAVREPVSLAGPGLESSIPGQRLPQLRSPARAATLLNFGRPRIQPTMMPPTDTVKPRIFLETFGCQMNVLDSEILLSRMERQHYELTGEVYDADVVCFNTCAVRDHA